MVSATSSGAANLKAEHRRQIRVVCVEQAPEPGGAQKIEWLDLTALSNLPSMLHPYALLFQQSIFKIENGAPKVN